MFGLNERWLEEKNKGARNKMSSVGICIGTNSGHYYLVP